MKTLKKTLCLVLAVVMAVGVLILPANAAYGDLKDTAEIDDDFKLAVEGLTNMGIISGETTSSFGAKNTLLRQQAAVIVTKTLLTADDQTTALAGYDKDAFTDLDSPAIYARKQINYLAAKGMVSGKGNNAFAPNDKVTTYELLTMLMRVAEAKNGYVPGNDGYTVEAMKFAVAYGALSTKGLEDLFTEPNTPPTREQTAQIVWNVITHKGNVSVTGTYKVTVGTGANATVYTGLTLEQAVMLRLAATNQNVSVEPENAGGKTIGEVVYGIVEEPQKDELGRVTMAWTDGEVNYVETPREARTVEKGTFNCEKLIKDVLKLDPNKESAKIHYIENGDETNFFRSGTTYLQADEDDYVLITKASAYTFGQPYGTIEAYYVGTDDDGVKMFDVVAYAYKIKVVAAGDISDGKLTLETDVTVDAGSIKAGDVVQYNMAGDDDEKKPCNVVALTPATGAKVTSKSTTNDHYIYVNNQKMYFAGESTGVTFSTVNFTSSYAVYTNGAGYIAYMRDEADTSTIAPTVNKYLYVLRYQEQDEGTAGTDLLGNTSGTNKAADAAALVIDPLTGTVSVVHLAIAKDANGEWWIADANGNAVTTTNIEQDSLGKKATDRYSAGVYTYTMYGDKYVLTQANSSTGVYVGSNLTINKGQAKVTYDTSKVVYANAATSLVVVTYNNDEKAGTAAFKTGYTSFEDLTVSNPSSNVSIAIVEYKDSIATRIFAIVPPAAPGSTTTTPSEKAIYVGKGDETVDGIPYTFIIDGKEVTYTAKTGTTIGTFTKGNFVAITLENGNLKGVVLSNTLAEGKKPVESKKVVVVSDGYIVVADDDNGTGAVVLYTNDKTVAYNAADAAGGLGATVAVGDTVNYYATTASETLTLDIVVITAHKTA